MTTVEETASEPDTPHLCDPPELGAGESWKCPEPSCGATYGQQFPTLPPGTEAVNVGFLLHEIGDACIEVGHSFAAGTPPRDVQNAFYRLGGQLERAARVFARTDVIMPMERPGV